MEKLQGSRSKTLERRSGEAIIEDAWAAFRYLTGDDDFDHFASAFVGRFATCADFGEHLLRTTYGANEHLSRLPAWLHGYLRIDGEQVARDFAQQEKYVFIEKPEDGVYVYDAIGLDLHDIAAHHPQATHVAQSSTKATQ